MKTMPIQETVTLTIEALSHEAYAIGTKSMLGLHTRDSEELDAKLRAQTVS